jgi:hypothetical protein
MKTLKSLDLTTIKMGFLKACKSEEMRSCIRNAVDVCSRVAAEGSMLASLHIVRLLEEKHELPEVDQTFFSRCFAAISSLHPSTKLAKNSAATNDPEISKTLSIYKELCPEDYMPVHKLPYMTPILASLAKESETNFINSIEMTFFSRMKRWFIWRLKPHMTELKSATRVANVLSALAMAPDQEASRLSKLHFQTRQMLDRILERKEEKLGNTEATWILMQKLVDDARDGLIYPVELKKSPHLYLPCLHRMLCDLQQDYSDDRPEDDEEDAGGRNGSNKKSRLFSLLPQRRLQAGFIPITNTALKGLEKAIIKDKKQRNTKDNADIADTEMEEPSTQHDSSAVAILSEDDHARWKRYFNLPYNNNSRIKKFKGYMCTDGMSVSLCLAKVKPIQQQEDEGGNTQGTRKKKKRKKNNPSDGPPRVIPKPKEGTRVLGLDPGRKFLFTAVVHKEEKEKTNPVIRW